MSESAPTFGQRKKRRRLFAGLGILGVLSLAATTFITTDGTPRQQLKINDTNVWAIRSGASSYYGSVNTSISELSSIHTGHATSFPVAGVLQDSTNVVLYSTQSILPLDPAHPVDIDPQETLPPKPLGADHVVSSGSYAAFLNTANGKLGGITIADLAKGKDVATINSKEGNAQSTEQFVASTITSDGLIYAVSSDGSAITYDLATKKRNNLANGITIPTNLIDTQMSVFDDNHWALLMRTETSSELWIDGTRSTYRIAETASIASPDTTAPSLALADTTGLHLFEADGTHTTAATSGDPLTGTSIASPIWYESCVYAAWSTGASMYATACNAPIEKLDFNDNAAGTNGEPVFRINNNRLILNDNSNGLIWNVIDKEYTLVPSSALWNKDTENAENIDTAQTKDAKTNECPVAASGAQAEFGVRPDQSANIPVLTGAFDPNPGDTLSIVPSENSPAWNGNGIGNLSLSSNNQSVTLAPTAATGSASFTYTLTDGANDCAITGTANVSVHPDNIRTAPEYRSVQNDSLKHLQVSPGGSLRFDGLAGWVDPDGDPIYISSVSASEGTVAATPQGSVAYRADDDQEPGTVTLTVNVADGHGDGISSQTFTVTVAESPTLHARSFSRSVPVDTSTTIDLSEHITGISLGDVRTSRAEIVGASVDNESLQNDITIQSNSDELSLTVTPHSEAIFPITFKIESGASQATATLLVNSHRGNTHLSVPPLTAFVRPNEDVTIDPLSLAVNPSGNVLLIRDIQTSPISDAALTASAVYGSQLRISGQTPNNSAGRIGTLTYTVSDGSEQAKAQVSVFQLDEAASTKPVTITDQVTVRAGEQINIPVLENDVPASGTTLTLDPTYVQDDETGLTFASSTSLRYLAPTEPGYYTVFYRAYALGHSHDSTEGHVNVHVTAPGENRTPNAKPIDARVEAFGRTIVDIPTFGVDPDGDDTFVTAITQPAQGGSVRLLSDGRIQVDATAEEGLIEFDYTLSDAQSATSTNHVRVGIIADAPNIPVAYNDYVETAPGTGTISLDPTLNDYSSKGHKLTVDKVELKPVNSADSAGMNGKEPTMKASVGKNNTVTVQVPDQPGKVIYRYTVSAHSDDEDTDSSGSQAEGMIVVNATEYAVPTYPVVRDTYVNSSDINDDTFTTDVLTDKVIWSGSDITAELKSPSVSLSLNDGIMRGSITENRQVIPFTVSGENKGETLTTWAFVKVPQANNILPELRDPTRQYTVNQNESITIDLAQAISPYDGRSVRINAAQTSGARQGASCSVSGTSVTYNAGNAPLGDTDSCHVSVQWDGYNRSATQLPLPIHIVLDDPPPTIRPQQVAVVDPGQNATYNLADAVTWQGKDKSTLSYACDPATGATGVTVTCTGATARITADETAQQGATVSFNVRIVSPTFTSGVPQARMTAQIGTLAPLTLNPVGTSVTINAGQSASVTTEDLLALNSNLRHYGTLSLVPGSVSFPNSGLTGSINGGRVTITAGAHAQGGRWSGSVRIQDSQNNTGTIPINVTLNARPNSPRVAVKTVGDGYVTLLIQDNTVASVPGVTGYNVSWSGAGGSGRTSCDAGDCTINGLRNYQTVNLSVTSENEQGDSAPTAVTNVYAYKAPAAPKISFVGPKAGGQAEITVTPGDNSQNSIAVHVGSQIQHIVTKASTLTIGGLNSGRSNATEVYAVTQTAVRPPQSLQQNIKDTAQSESIYAYSIDKPILGGLEVSYSGAEATARISNIASGGDGVEWFWLVNGKQYGDVQKTTGAQTGHFPASALKQNEDNTIALKAYSTDQGVRVGEWASSTIGPVTVSPVTYPSSAENVQYAYDSNGQNFTLLNTTSADGKFQAVLDEMPNPNRCSAVMHWEMIGKGLRSPSYNVSPRPGSPCYGINIDLTNFTDTRITGPSTWSPTISNLPPFATDYAIDVQWKSLSTNNGGKLEVSVANGVATIDPQKQKTWYAIGAPYEITVTITFKGQLEGINPITKTVRMSQ